MTTARARTHSTGRLSSKDGADRWSPGRARFMGVLLVLLSVISAAACYLVFSCRGWLRGRSADPGRPLFPVDLPPLVKKFGPKNLVIAAAALINIGLLWLSQTTPSTGYAFIVVPTIFCGVGIGIAFTAVNFTVLAGLPPQNTGVPAGMLQTMQQVGGALGITVLSTIYISRLDDALKTGSTCPSSSSCCRF